MLCQTIFYWKLNKQQNLEEQICEYSGIAMQYEFMNFDEKSLKEKIDYLQKDN